MTYLALYVAALALVRAALDYVIEDRVVRQRIYSIMTAARQAARAQLAEVATEPAPLEVANAGQGMACYASAPGELVSVYIPAGVTQQGRQRDRVWLKAPRQRSVWQIVREWFA